MVAASEAVDRDAWSPADGGHRGCCVPFARNREARRPGFCANLGAFGVVCMAYRARTAKQRHVLRCMRPHSQHCNEHTLLLYAERLGRYCLLLVIEAFRGVRRLPSWLRTLSICKVGSSTHAHSHVHCTSTHTPTLSHARTRARGAIQQVKSLTWRAVGTTQVILLAWWLSGSFDKVVFNTHPAGDEHLVQASHSETHEHARTQRARAHTHTRARARAHTHARTQAFAIGVPDTVIKLALGIFHERLWEVEALRDLEYKRAYVRFCGVPLSGWCSMRHLVQVVVGFLAVANYWLSCGLPLCCGRGIVGWCLLGRSR